MLLPDAQSAEGGKQLLSVSFSARLIAENDAYFFCPAGGGSTGTPLL